MKPTNKGLLVIYIFLIMGLFFAGHASAAGPWKGRILDMDTGEPLEDAVIVAEWHKTSPSVGGAVGKYYHAKEVVTDKDGYFEVTAYTPVSFPPIITWIEGPYFTVFKPGYLSLKGFSGDFLLSGATDAPDEKKAMWPMHKYTTRLAANLIELPKLNTKEERKRNLTLPHVPREIIQNYIRLINEERATLGLEPSIKGLGNEYFN